MLNTVGGVLYTTVDGGEPLLLQVKFGVTCSCRTTASECPERCEYERLQKPVPAYICKLQGPSILPQQVYKGHQPLLLKIVAHQVEL
jgi:hypothetical protein